MERKARLYGCVTGMSVTCLFSLNNLIDYFPALWPARVNVHVSTRYLRTSVKQTVTFAPLPYPSSKKALSSWLQARSWSTVRRSEERNEKTVFTWHCELIVALWEEYVWYSYPWVRSAIRRTCHCTLHFPGLLCRVVVSWWILVLHLVYAVNACHIWTHSHVAARTHAHGVLVKID